VTSSAALDHITVTAADLAASAAFYDSVLGALGLHRHVELVDEEEDAPEVEALAWAPPDGPAVLWLVHGAPATTGLHLRFRAAARADVETFHAAGVAAGAVSRAAPRRWAIYRRGEYGAMLADPAGNVVEAVAAE
jgi:catechol 2,3-dioxygenase-like lactoylglutathione lyase family enzyme